MKYRGLNLNSYHISETTGYGKAYVELLAALERKGTEITSASWNTLNWCMPKDYVFSEYTVGYTPWESTEIPESWKEPLSKVQDFWTPASWLVDVFKDYVPDVFVLPHGINSKEFPIISRGGNKKFRFIHIGEPALRKGGDILAKVWKQSFAHQDGIELVVKCNRVANPIFYECKNVTVLGGRYSDAELWREYALADCLVYPTRGEGFGLIPFEAMATGLPVITPQHMMGDFIHPTDLNLGEYKMVESSNQNIHPGLWMEHNEEELTQLMKGAIRYQLEDLRHAANIAKYIHEEYQWDTIADQALARLELKGS